MLKRTKFNIFISTILLNSIIYSQDCIDGFTFIENIPSNLNNINNDTNCFFDLDISFLEELIYINDLNYDSPLNAGPQTWVTGRLTVWVATYVPSGSNGLTQKISQLPASIGQVSELTTLFLEKHNLVNLPGDFTSLSNLANFYVSNNWLTTIPSDFGALLNLTVLDLGYNQLEFLPQSIGNLLNLEYLFLFNNQFYSFPESICSLNLDWDGISPANYPYFASGGNKLCDSELIPDCVENSANFNISMEQNYYSFLLDAPQDCCPSLGDLNGDEGYNVLDIVALANCVLANNCADSSAVACAADMNGDQGYNVLDIVALANCVLANNCG